MSDACHFCREIFDDDEFCLTCAICKNSFHIGTCSGVTDKAYRKKNKTAKESWKCGACANGKNGQKDTKPAEAAATNLADEIAEINRKLSLLLAMKSQVDALGGIKSTVDAIEASMKEMSSKYDEVLAEMKQQTAEIAGLKKRVVRLEEKSKTEDVASLKKEINDLEQYSRRQNLEIHGLPQHSDENLLEKLNNLANHLELPQLAETDLEAVHRLPSKPDKNGGSKVPTVLVRFSSHVTKEAWLGKKAQLRQEKSTIFFNENLTAQNKKLFWEMKAKAEEKEYQFAWHRNGKMFVRRGPRDRIIRIRELADLAKIT